MMAIMIELRIPLFIVGKPGSSKSLAKSVVTDVMQGEFLFKYTKYFYLLYILLPNEAMLTILNPMSPFSLMFL